MKNLILILSLSTFATSCFKGVQNIEQKEITSQKINMENNASIYDFTVETISGTPFKLSDLKGKKVMIVNTASKCGLTPQFEQLENLYQQYKDKNFVIIGFPSNDFMGQDPGTNDEIAEFCQVNYGVTFPMMGKISVKGDEKHPLYQYLTEKAKNGNGDYDVQWNFQKFLINEDGTMAKVIGPRTLPNDPEVIAWLNK